MCQYISAENEINFLVVYMIAFFIITWVFMIIYYFFSNFSIFLNVNEINLKNNLKILIKIYLMTTVFFILYIFSEINYHFYNNFHLSWADNLLVPEIYFLKIQIFQNYYNNLFIFHLNKFNLSFMLLFVILYPVIFSFMSYDYNNLHLKMYIYIYTIFVISYFILMIDNIILFFFTYELLLILIFYAMYLSANTRGSTEAAIYFTAWAVFGSILVGLGIILLIVKTNMYTFEDLKLSKLDPNKMYYVYLAFFFGFGVKLSVWPFWYWLPKAHVEVSTGMSIFLSCILIKLSLYCLLRIQHILMSEIPFSICIIFTFLSSIDVVFRFINLKDLKAIIAYSSVLHTNLLLALIHLDSFKILKTSIFYIWGHSLATASLFIIVNILETRYASRNIIYLSGVWYNSPFLGYLIFISLISFLDLPISVFFWGEIWLWVIALDQIFILTFQVLFLVNIVFVSIFFKIWWCVLFGTPESTAKKINISDLNYEVIFILLWLAFLQILLGVQPALLSYICGLYIICVFENFYTKKFKS